MRHYSIFILLALLCAQSCTESFLKTAEQIKGDSAMNVINDEDESLFYYFFDEKIPLQNSHNKLYVKFYEGTPAEKITALTGCIPFYESGAECNAVVINATDHPFTNDDIQDYLNFPEVEHVDYAVSCGSSELGITNRIRIKLKEIGDYNLLEDLSREMNLTIIQEERPIDEVFTVTTEKPANTLDIANLLSESNMFEFTSPDFFCFNLLMSADTFYDNQWAIKNTGQHNTVNANYSGIDIDAEEAWSITEGSSNIKVAVVDTYVNPFHPDLFNNTEPEISSFNQNIGSISTDQRILFISVQCKNC